MLLKRNLLETVTLASCGGTVLCILLNAVTNISPITGVWFLIYIVGLFIVSLLLSIRFIQWLLHLNRPLKYDLSWIESYPSLGFLREVLPQVKVRAEGECREYDTNELSVISTVLERRLVSSWYVPYVSEEIGFPFACKQLLDQMISKMFQICHKIETKDVFVDMCAITITHLKEYKKAVKRHEKSPTSPVDAYYKKTHPIFNSPDKKLTSADHCVNILRIILKELVPWELWDTPHSELLIRVLAKKLDHFVDNTLSDPAWLNDKLFMILQNKTEEVTIPEPKKDNVEGEKEKTVEIVEEKEVKKEQTPPPETKISFPIPAAEVKAVPSLPKVKEEPKEVTQKVNNVVEETVGTQPVEIKPTAVLRQRRGRQGRNEVKIYDRIIEGSVKTWETDMDLQCISVGQDLLASLDQMTLSRLWGQEDTEHSPNLRARSPQPLWFGEEDSIDIDHGEPSEVKEVKKENSPKPTDALLKDIQSTVHQAKSKIGDLQVPLDIDVPCKHSSDEAAGMMEGLLDMGLAGIKKGLRFTGLSDDQQEKSPLAHRERGKVTPPEPARAAVPRDPAPHATLKEEVANPTPLLVKQHRVTSQDSVPSQPSKPRDTPAVPRDPPAGPRDPPAGVLPVPLSESPEPEYEEVADLSTSIARLRSLLQETGNRSQYMFMEGAEETAGRTHHGSSRPVDTAALADEYDMSGESPSPRQATNNMQRLDRLFQRTVTGMLNSIKTAVSAEGEGLPQPPQDWGFVLAADDGVGGAVGRLLGARRSLWQVDAALDSLQQLPPAPCAARPTPDDWEEWCAEEGARWSGASEAAGAAAAPPHVVYRLATLLFAELGEALISGWLSELAGWLRAQVFEVFRRMAAPAPAPAQHQRRQFRPDETRQLLLDKLPGKYIFGEEAMSEAVGTVVASLSHKAINEDVIYRALDLLAVHFKKSAGLRNPSFDNN